MKNTLVAVVFILIFVGVIVLYIRRREEVFEGQIVDKDIVEGVNNSMPMNSQPGLRIGGPAGYGNVTHSYIVKVQIADGKTKTWNVSEGKYEIIKIGDHVVKPKGTTDLQIVSQTAAPGQQQPAGPAAQPPDSIIN